LVESSSILDGKFFNFDITNLQFCVDIELLGNSMMTSRGRGGFFIPPPPPPPPPAPPPTILFLLLLSS
jgi:hypothetical protein